MPSLLQRQLFREILHLFVLAVSVLLTLLVISRAVQMRDMLLGLDISLLDTVRLFGYMLPLFLMLTLPVACMLSVFLTFLRMGTDRELVALRAGGVSIYQMLFAPLLFAVLCMGLTFWVSLHLLSWGMGQFRAELLEIAATRARVVIQPGVFSTDFPNIVLFARQVDPVSGELHQVMVNDATRPERTITILAPEGDIGTNHAAGTLVFTLRRGKLYSISADAQSSVLGFNTYTLNLPLDAVFKGVSIEAERPQEMRLDYLHGLIRQNEAAAEALRDDPAQVKKYDQLRRWGNRLWLEVHKRWAYPVACLALTLFVLPLGTAFQGMHRQIGMVLTLVMFFVYYSLMSLGFSLGENGVLPAWVCLWTPNALFMLLGMYGLRLTARERMPDLISSLRLLRERVWRRPASGGKGGEACA